MAWRKGFLLVVSLVSLAALGIALSGLGMHGGGVSAGAAAAAQNAGTANSEQAAGAAKLGDDADFKARCHAPGVVRCVGFDSRSDIAGHTDPDASGVYSPEIDTSVSASGRGSMKFTVPSFSKANSSGQYSTDFRTICRCNLIRW